MWDTHSPKGVMRSDSLVEELMVKKWSCFMGRGAKIYHHGRRYESGNATLDVLDIDNDDIARRETAREVIASIYPVDMEYPRPLIVQELGADTALENTTVGKFLGMTSLGLVPIVPGESSASQPEGINWLDSLIDLFRIPVQGAISFAMALWSFLDRLRSHILSVMMPSSIGISLHHVSSSFVEALITLPGGIRVIVGYGLNGPYWRPWASRDEHEVGFQISDDDSTSDTGGEDPTENDEDPQNHQYTVFGHIFDSVFSTMPSDTSHEPEPTVPEPTSSFWGNCAVM